MENKTRKKQAEILSIKVTKIKKRWHARLLELGHPIDESACEKKSDIGFICREMLRWYDKLGGLSRMADRSRTRAASNWKSHKQKSTGKCWTMLLNKENKHEKD